MVMMSLKMTDDVTEPYKKEGSSIFWISTVQQLVKNMISTYLIVALIGALIQNQELVGPTQHKDKMTKKNFLKDLGYKVVGHLGTGGFSQVKMATAERHPEPVAIKIIDPGFPELVQIELTILKTVRHPNIIQVHSIFEMPDGHTFIVMEAAQSDLNFKIADLKVIPVNKAKLWFSQLVKAVAYLHQQDIVHRDLKPKNVLLTADNQVKLTDFGIAAFSKGFPELRYTFLGTPDYAAPEILKNLPYDPKKSDVWSLGVILYEMLTGTLPYKGPTNVPVKEPCRSLIKSMLRFNPSNRPSVEELAQHPWLQSTEEQ